MDASGSISLSRRRSSWGLTRARANDLPGRRWLGCGAAFSQLLFLKACHGLLLPAYAKFCNLVGDRVTLFSCLDPTANGLSDCSRVPNENSCIRRRAVGVEINLSSPRFARRRRTNARPLVFTVTMKSRFSELPVLNMLRGIARRASDRPFAVGLCHASLRSESLRLCQVRSRDFHDLQSSTPSADEQADAQTGAKPASATPEVNAQHRSCIVGCCPSRKHGACGWCSRRSSGSMAFACV